MDSQILEPDRSHGDNLRLLPGRETPQEPLRIQDRNFNNHTIEYGPLPAPDIRNFANFPRFESQDPLRIEYGGPNSDQREFVGDERPRSLSSPPCPVSRAVVPISPLRSQATAHETAENFSRQSSEHSYSRARPLRIEYTAPTLARVNSDAGEAPPPPSRSPSDTPDQYKSLPSTPR